MQLGDKLDDSKIYPSFRFFNGLPITQRDLESIQDSERLKMKMLLSAFYFQGVFGDFAPTVSARNVTIPKAMINLGGDLYVIAKDGGAATTLAVSTLANGVSERVDSICIEGFFEEITASTTVPKYGGLANTQDASGLTDPDLNMQVSTRYQFKWRIRQLEGISDMTTVIPMKKDGSDLTGKTYQAVPGEPSLFKIEDSTLGVLGNTQYLIRLFRVRSTTSGNLDATAILLEDTAKLPAFFNFGTKKSNTPKGGSAYWDGTDLYVYDSTIPKWVRMLRKDGPQVFSGNLTVQGDYTVIGDMVDLDVWDVYIKGDRLTFHSKTTGTPSSDAGIHIERGDLPNAKLIWDEAAKIWRADLGNNKYQDLVINANGQDIRITDATKGLILTSPDGTTFRMLVDNEGVFGTPKAQVVTSLPTASSAHRGRVVMVKGATNVADAIYMCKKLADESYDWIQIA